MKWEMCTNVTELRRQYVRSQIANIYFHIDDMN
jgi:hypothetical protein